MGSCCSSADALATPAQGKPSSTATTHKRKRSSRPAAAAPVVEDRLAGQHREPSDDVHVSPSASHSKKRNNNTMPILSPPLEDGETLVGGGGGDDMPSIQLLPPSPPPLVEARGGQMDSPPLFFRASHDLRAALSRSRTSERANTILEELITDTFQISSSTPSDNGALRSGGDELSSWVEISQPTQALLVDRASQPSYGHNSDATELDAVSSERGFPLQDVRRYAVAQRERERRHFYTQEAEARNRLERLQCVATQRLISRLCKEHFMLERGGMLQLFFLERLSYLLWITESDEQLRRWQLRRQRKMEWGAARQLFQSMMPVPSSKRDPQPIPGSPREAPEDADAGATTSERGSAVEASRSASSSVSIDEEGTDEVPSSAIRGRPSSAPVILSLRGGGLTMEESSSSTERGSAPHRWRRQWKAPGVSARNAPPPATTKRVVRSTTDPPGGDGG